METLETHLTSIEKNTRERLCRLIANRFIAARRQDPGYLTDLGLEALVVLYAAWGERRYIDYVNEVIQYRGAYPQDSLNWRILFTDLHSTAWRWTGDPTYVEGWLDDLYYYENALTRDSAGRILFFIDVEKPRLLVDMLQGYCMRLARAGLLTGDGDYFDRCAEQYELFAQILINPLTGLWHHGRGWVPNDPLALSPDGWCRGQAWVLRGIVESMSCMPRSCRAFSSLQALLDQLATALFVWQTSTGMWHQVMQKPYESFPEMSGTGMIVHYLGEALRQDLLSRPQPWYTKALRRAQAALLEFIDTDGHVYNGCAHGAPMATYQDYLDVRPVQDDPHAIAGAIMALAHDLSSEIEPTRAEIAERPTIAFARNSDADTLARFA